MAYSDFTLENVERLLEITIQETPLFSHGPIAAVPEWLPPTLARGARTALVTEKSRSEFIVAPILLAARELSGEHLSIFSGKRLDVDASRGLVGECDFILSMAPPVPVIHAPIMMIVEAKKHDIEDGLGQCIAQMVAAKTFNATDLRKNNLSIMYGCVTTGITWKFLKLSDSLVTLDLVLYNREHVDRILGVFQTIYEEAAKTA